MNVMLISSPVYIGSCLVWEGDWTVSLLNESTWKSRRGAYAKVLLTVCGKVFSIFFFLCLMQGWSSHGFTTLCVCMLSLFIGLGYSFDLL